MRSTVIFQHPAEFVPVSAEDSILSADGADWFVFLLRQIRGLEIEPGLCQEDWGVVVFAQRNDKRIWVGLTFLWPGEKQMWLAHFHHPSFAWLQRWSASGSNELQRLILDAHAALSTDASVSRVSWHHERDMTKENANGSATPTEG